MTSTSDRADSDTATLTVTVLFFAAARDAAGLEHTQVEATAPASVAGLLDELCRRYRGLEPHRATLRVAVNQEYVEPGRLLADGDELALIPPVCGG